MLARFQSDANSAPRQGLVLLQVLIVGLFCVFALRLWYLQVHKGAYYAEKAMDNRLRQEPMYAPRGLIRDRDGRLTAVNEPAYALGLVREDVEDLEATLGQVSRLTGVPRAELREKYDRLRRRVKPFETMVLAPDLAFDTLARVEALALRWPGLEIVVRPKRHYPQGELLAHVLGYVAEADEKELEERPELDLGDTVGKQGLEYVLEDRLRGTKGLRQMEVDASGRGLNDLVVKPPRAGRNLTLSIDLDLQRKATDLLRSGNHTGSVVALEPFSGQVLALVTNPSYNNNDFATGLSTKQWAELRDDPRHPMQNRVIQSAYPPGSVFKLIMAGAAMWAEKMDPGETVYCPGHYRLGRRVFRCWKKRGHGHMDLEQALVQSCDVYFYEWGHRLGVDRIEEFAKACGFGERTGISLPHERSGLIPSREWKRKRFGQRWQGGENLNMAIGQGYTLVTPLQVARFLGGLINGGDLLRPRLLAGGEPEKSGSVPLDRRQRLAILDIMRDTVESPRGTCRRLEMDGAVIGGKTGTAQVVRLKEEDRGAETEEIKYRFRDHSWVATWGIKDGRAVVIVVMVEHGGHGSESSLPVAKAMYRFLYDEGAAMGPTWPYVTPDPPEVLRVDREDPDEEAGGQG
ncbi:penicillin-binding protein 2 [Desulfohalovibrio reitneri]|uniref:penicillin-binding protein 2 n=1 Tax=Desulfohalovibrio reitneri TaxID=1307759 RepID=UPI00068A2923|nr:penicillin-binding protein 2 [Desulfohalovibrio reitneri]